LLAPGEVVGGGVANVEKDGGIQARGLDQIGRAEVSGFRGLGRGGQALQAQDRAHNRETARGGLARCLHCRDILHPFTARMIIIHAMNDLGWHPGHAMVAGDLTSFRGQVNAVR
jgi:hypothetical protein